MEKQTNDDVGSDDALQLHKSPADFDVLISDSNAGPALQENSENKKHWPLDRSW